MIGHIFQEALLGNSYSRLEAAPVQAQPQLLQVVQQRLLQAGWGRLA